MRRSRLALGNDLGCPLHMKINDPELDKTFQAMENLGMSDSGLDYKQLTNDLRLRVLEGWDPPAEAMLQITNQIRQGRRAAAAKSANANRKSRSSVRESTNIREDLRAVLDQEME